MGSKADAIGIAARACRVLHLPFLAFGLMVLGTSCTAASPQAASPSNPEMKLKRLCFVSSGATTCRVYRYSRITPETIAVVQDSPFDSISVPLAEDETYESAKPAIELIKANKKMFWPRLTTKPLANNKAGIVDVWNAGIVDGFCAFFQTGLQVAKDSGSDGIFFDPEFYKNTSANYMVSIVAKTNGKTADETVAGMRELGVRLADIIHDVYGDKLAVIWTTFTKFERPNPDGYYFTVTYLVEGMLNRITEKNYPITVVDGGETTISYFHFTMADLSAKIKRQKADLEPYVKKYAPHFKLGACTNVFLDLDHINKPYKVNWDSVRKHLDNPVTETKTIDDFKPVFTRLFETYEYVWVFWDGGDPLFDDFVPASSHIFRPVIRDTLESMKKPE